LRTQGEAPSCVLLSARSATQPLSAPLQHGIGLLPPPLPAAPSARLATRVPSSLWHTGREDNRLTTFRRCKGVDRPYLYAGGSTAAPEEFEAPGPGHAPVGPSDSAAFAAAQQLSLVLSDDACDTLPGLTLPLHPSSQPPLLLAVAVAARALAALPREEATLSRGLLSRYDTAGRTAGAIDANHLA